MELVHSHERCLRHVTTFEAVATHDDIRCWIGQFADFKRNLCHLSRLSLVVGRHGEHDILTHLSGFCHIVAGALCNERTATHAHRNGIGRNTWHTDTHRVLESGIEHIHQVGSNRSSRRCGNHRILLQEVATHGLTGCIACDEITAERMFADASGRERILTLGIDLRAVDVDFRLHGRIDGSHDDIGIEHFARIECGLLGDDEGIELVHTDVLHVDVRNQCVKHLALCIAHVALQLRKQCHGGSHGHVFKHIFLPVLTQRTCRLRHLRGKVAGDDFLLLRIGHHLQDAITIGVDHLKQMTALAGAGSQHDLTCCLQVVLGLDVIDVGVLAVSLGDDSLFQLLGKIV